MTEIMLVLVLAIGAGLWIWRRWHRRVPVAAGEHSPDSAQAESAGTIRTARADELEPWPVRTPLPPHLRERVERLQADLSEVYPMTLEEWLDGFERDAHPAGEIEWWERLSNAYGRAMEGGRFRPDQGPEVFRSLTRIALAGAGDREEPHGEDEAGYLKQCLQLAWR